ncbi:unnamed protein product [Chrysodeixis includens]|nr:unnamed protein product [Chrysodeixis includens]
MASALPQGGRPAGSQVHFVNNNEDQGSQVSVVNNVPSDQVQVVNNNDPGQVQVVNNNDNEQQVQFVDNSDAGQQVQFVENSGNGEQVNVVDNNAQQVNFVNNNRPTRPTRPGRPGQIVIANPDPFFGQPSVGRPNGGYEPISAGPAFVNNNNYPPKQYDNPFARGGK